ncbi:hypothetical protein PTSG_09553 [Salpingoeca rosetta]|uniref:RING-type domain-containing protein n=1 Tax=Salpingoeca rosetta (strain ATCC 50818 / BSB-021) TaxID=946362 RepID=F2ULB9_SALR5|nr:uncharacterized protein PTSG_09553 [Salpingoeca rosetta]EGD77918.1 hypothetical protein PTSG_09553 [Salpingoeca rosetta]|eukprot:XP_004989982.1 hypothetical protein PTSG_09553 [Salpingoeca rosetta]
MPTHQHLNSILLSSVQRNDLLHVRLILAQGANPNATNTCGWTALHFAAELPRRTAILFALLHAGARVNSICAYTGQTPLHVASIAGNLPAVKLLLNCGADMFLRDFNNQTPREVARPSSLLRRVVLGPTAYDYLTALEHTMLVVSPNALRHHPPNPLQAGRSPAVRRQQHQQQQRQFRQPRHHHRRGTQGGSDGDDRRQLLQDPGTPNMVHRAALPAPTATTTSATATPATVTTADAATSTRAGGVTIAGTTNDGNQQRRRRRVRVFGRWLPFGGTTRQDAQQALTPTGDADEDEDSNHVELQPAHLIHQHQQQQQQQQHGRNGAGNGTGGGDTGIVRRSRCSFGWRRRSSSSNNSNSSADHRDTSKCTGKRGRICQNKLQAGRADGRIKLTPSQVAQLATALECGICLDTMEDPVTLPCGHSFCGHCCQQLVSSTRARYFSCPLDRSKFPRHMPLGTAVTLRNVVACINRHKSVTTCL